MFKDLEFNVMWSEEDGEWVATCNKCPSLSYLSGDIEEAILGIINLVQQSIKALIHEKAMKAFYESLERYGEVYRRLADN